MKKIIKMSNKNIALESIKKIYSWRFIEYKTKFITETKPSLDEHVLFLKKQLSGKKSIWFGLFEETIKNKLRKLIGCGCLYNYDKTISSYELGRLMIDPLSTSKGNGTKLLFFLIEYAKKELKAKRIIIHVRKDNLVAIKLYTKFGFTIKDNDLIYKLELEI